MNEMFPSDYLKGDDLKPKGKAGVRAVIAAGALEEMADGGFKPVLRFKGSKKGMVLNKTNGDILAEAYGEDSDDWIGKPIVVYFDPNVTYAGKKTGGIRVRIPVDGRAPASAEGREEPPPPEDENPGELEETDALFD